MPGSTPRLARGLLSSVVTKLDPGTLAAPSMLIKRFLLTASEIFVRTAAHFTPTPALRRIYRRATDGLGVAICLHRVTPRRRKTDPYPKMTVDPRAVDNFLAIAAAPGQDGAPLLMSFDDGYADAAHYIATRARRFPHVRWMFFVCPEKTAKQVGFRWDLYEQRRAQRRSVSGFEEFLATGLDIDRENQREPLRDLARRPEFRLASVEQCRRLLRLPNVELGNHSDSHFNLCLLPPADAERELERSTLRFEELFGGRAEHFAFPFSGDGQVGGAQVRYLRALRNPVLWTTYGRPYPPETFIPGSVLPRFVFPGGWSGRAMALWIAVQSLRYRAWPRHLNEIFGAPPPRATAPATDASSASLSA